MDTLPSLIQKEMVSGVYCRDGPWIGERGYGEMIQNEQTQGQFP